jgi:hypothetical protein
MKSSRTRMMGTTIMAGLTLLFCTAPALIGFAGEGTESAALITGVVVGAAPWEWTMMVLVTIFPLLSWTRMVDVTSISADVVLDEMVVWAVSEDVGVTSTEVAVEDVWVAVVDVAGVVALVELVVELVVEVVATSDSEDVVWATEVVSEEMADSVELREGVELGGTTWVTVTVDWALGEAVVLDVGSTVWIIVIVRPPAGSENLLSTAGPFTAWALMLPAGAAPVATPALAAPASGMALSVVVFTSCRATRSPTMARTAGFKEEEGGWMRTGMFRWTNKERKGVLADVGRGSEGKQKRNNGAQSYRRRKRKKEAEEVNDGLEENEVIREAMVATAMSPDSSLDRAQTGSSTLLSLLPSSVIISLGVRIQQWLHEYVTSMTNVHIAQ